jgi:ubiquinone/menaquinone biosynthesis C-methylase UbiE
MAHMATAIDPAGAEPRAILQAVNFRNTDILEVGAGDGRLTLRYAQQVRSVVGIDTKEPEIRSAAKISVTEHRGQTQFLCANGIHLPFSDEAFGIVLLGSSL